MSLLSSIHSNLTDTWVTGTTYNQYATIIKNGYPLTCQATHTAGTFATDVQSGYWLMASTPNNLIINGNFDVWQRGTTFTTQGQYCADRMYLDYVINATITLSNSSPLPNSTNFLRCTTTGSGAFNLSHALESAEVNKIKNKTVTASVYVRRNATMSGDFVLAISKNATANTQSGGSWSSISTAVLLNANVPTNGSWVRLILTVTVPNDGTANGLKVWLYNTANNATGSTWDYSQLMLHEGPAPASFQTAAPSISAELALCQRYYRSFTAASGSFLSMAVGMAQTATVTWYALPLTFRSQPVATYTGTLAVIQGNTQFNVSALQTFYFDAGGSVSLQATCATGLTAGNSNMLIGNGTSITVSLSAEL